MDNKCQAVPFGWIVKAKDILSHYKKPLIDIFIDDKNLAKKRTKLEKLNVIEKAVKDVGKTPCFEDLVEHLDELKFYGKQHIFLYKFKSINESYLKKLRNPTHIKECLRQHKLEHLYNNKEIVWKPTRLQLTEVKHSFENGEGQLFFKWVESRSFDQMIGRRLKSQTERSCNFFIINLADGSAEIRIQLIPSRAKKSLRTEFEIYKNEIRKFVDLNHFSIIPLEPLIKQFIGKSVFKMSYLVFGNPSKGRINKPNLFKNPGLLFKKFFSKEVGLTATFKKQKLKVKGKPVYFYLNGESNEIGFTAISDKEKINFLLQKLRNFGKKSKIKMEALEEFEMIHPEYSPIISLADYQFSKLKNTEVTAVDFSKKIWFDMDTIKRVFELIAQYYPKEFTFTGNNKNTLSLNTKLDLKEGLLDFTMRKTVKMKGFKKKIIRTLVSSAMAVSYGCISTICDESLSWAWGKTFQLFFPFIPFLLFKVTLLIFLAILFLGGRTILYKIPKKVLDILLFFAKVPKDLQKDYEKWKDQIQNANQAIALR